jgi:hypothetical protein
MKRLLKSIQQALTPDLLKPEYRGLKRPFAGHCYVASEALFHLSDRTLYPHFIRHEGAPHWYLKDGRGRVYDLTAEQFSTPVPYEQGVRKGFLTKKPSARTKVVIQRVKTSD